MQRCQDGWFCGGMCCILLRCMGGSCQWLLLDPRTTAWGERTPKAHPKTAPRPQCVLMELGHSSMLQQHPP